MKTSKIFFSMLVALALIGQTVSYVSAAQMPQGQKQGIVCGTPNASVTES